MRVFILITGLFFHPLCNYAQDIKAREYLFKMLDAIDRVKTAKYTLLLHEHVNNRFRDSEFRIKLHVNPFRLYAFSVHPNPGAEALLIDGTNNQKALINPNRFPFINLNLSAQSSLLRKNHHYTFYEIGFSYIEKILKGYISRNPDAFFKSLLFADSIEYNGKNYYLLEINTPSFAYVDYVVKQGENLSTIANKILVNDYKILTINPGIDYYDDVKAGQVIKVPNAFAKKIVFYMDKNNLLPLVQIVYDENGLYGKYEIRDLIVNPVFDANEFTPAFKGYRF